MGKCVYCGKETDVFVDWEGHFGWGIVYNCRDCLLKLDDYFAWRGDQTSYRKFICPWCGHERDAAYEPGAEHGEMTCEACGQPFEWFAEVKVRYTSMKRECDYSGEIPKRSRQNGGPGDK